MNTETTPWHAEFSLETTATPEAVWGLFSDVERWKEWNAGIEAITIAGPFAVGTEFSMKPPGEDVVVSRLVRVEENVGFTDETRVGDLTILVDHRIERSGATRVRVLFAVEARGPGAAAVGAAITSDFEAVLRALAERAERGTSGRALAR
jgi:hypothetical protein